MKIITDFIPKPGDETTYTFSDGYPKKYIWVICPECGNGRWVSQTYMKKLYFTGLCHHCHTKSKFRMQLGSSSPNWTGGKFTDKHGYNWVTIYSDSPFWSMCSRASCRGTAGYIREHRLIMAQYLGRPLKSWEYVHHINGIKNDNRVENLRLTTGRKHWAEPISDMTKLEERVAILEARNIQLEAEMALLKAQLVKE